MTRKDYVIISQALSHGKPEGEAERHTFSFQQWERDVRYIATALKVDNPRFDTDKFLEACGVDKL